MHINSLTKKVELYFGEEKYRIECIAIITANGVIVSIIGGEEPHIGAVAIAVPRPSLMDSEKISSTTSVYTLIGHKDDEVAKPAAEKLSSKLNETVVVIAGIHVDKATAEEIKILMNNSKKVVEMLIEIIGYE